VKCAVSIEDTKVVEQTDFNRFMTYLSVRRAEELLKIPA